MTQNINPNNQPCLQPCNFQSFYHHQSQVPTTAYKASNVPEHIIDPARLSSWSETLLTVATLFNSLFRAKKFRDSEQQYTIDDIDLSRKHLIKCSQQNSFHLTNSSLKKGIKPHSKCNIHAIKSIVKKPVCSVQVEDFSLLPMVLKWRNVLLYYMQKVWLPACILSMPTLYASIREQNLTKKFVQQRYHLIALRKCLLSNKFWCFLCRSFEGENIQPIMAPLPAFRFPAASKKFPFANSEVDFFGLFNIEDTERDLEKHYGLIFLYLPGHRTFYLESCPNLNTDFFLNAFRRFTSRRGQAVMLYSDKGKFFIGALEELKKSVQNLNIGKIFKFLRLLIRRENSTRFMAPILLVSESAWYRQRKERCWSF